MTNARAKRIDQAGRDVTDLPGLWDESDRFCFSEESTTTTEAEQAADQHMKRCGLKSEAIRKAYIEGYCEGRRIENLIINTKIYEAIRKILSA